VHPIYNLESIVEAIPRVVTTFPEAVFVFRDYNTNPAYKNTLQDLIQGTNCTSSTRWVKRVEPWELIVGLYQAAQVAVSVPSSDGTPVSVLEAMACGVPVIASDLPSLREWIIPGETGILVPPNDSGALAEAIIQLLRDPALRKRIGAQSRRIVQERANHHTEMQKMEKLYLSLL
jgi:glycosyltransferase involved in cell wall biosynthesis